MGQIMKQMVEVGFDEIANIEGLYGLIRIDCYKIDSVQIVCDKILSLIGNTDWVIAPVEIEMSDCYHDEYWTACYVKIFKFVK